MFSAPMNDDDERPIRPGTLRRVVGIFRPYRGTVLGVAVLSWRADTHDVLFATAVWREWRRS